MKRKVGQGIAYNNFVEGLEFTPFHVLWRERGSPMRLVSRYSDNVDKQKPTSLNREVAAVAERSEGYGSGWVSMKRLTSLPTSPIKGRRTDRKEVPWYQ